MGTTGTTATVAWASGSVIFCGCAGFGLYRYCRPSNNNSRENSNPLEVSDTALGMKRQSKAWGSEKEMHDDLSTAVEEVIPETKLP